MAAFAAFAGFFGLLGLAALLGFAGFFAAGFFAAGEIGPVGGESFLHGFTFAGHPVAVRQGNILAVAFHPELSGDLSLHRWLVDRVHAA